MHFLAEGSRKETDRRKDRPTDRQKERKKQ